MKAAKWSLWPHPCVWAREQASQPVALTRAEGHLPSSVWSRGTLARLSDGPLGREEQRTVWLGHSEGSDTGRHHCSQTAAGSIPVYFCHAQKHTPKLSTVIMQGAGRGPRGSPNATLHAPTLAAGASLPEALCPRKPHLLSHSLLESRVQPQCDCPF